MANERDPRDGTGGPAAAPPVARPVEVPRPRPSRPGAVPPPVPSRPKAPPPPVPSSSGAAVPAPRASAPGAPPPPLPSAAAARPTKDGEPWRPAVRFGALTDVGKLRKHNEDHLLVRPDLGLFVVADGMGGHNAGDVASRLATTSLGNFFEATRTGPVPGAPTPDDERLGSDARRLAAAVRKANADVHEISSTHRQHRGMGSTVVALYVPRASGWVHVAHVGDSRCYRLRDGKLEQLTRDHSLINDALELKPDLTPAELARLPKNIITRALGMKDAVVIDVRSEPLRPGDTFLLCSDGLSGPVKESQIHDLLAEGGDPVATCEKLVAAANDGGGNDNISAVVVRADAEEVEVELVEVDELLSSAPPPDPEVSPSPFRARAPRPHEHDADAPLSAKAPTPAEAATRPERPAPRLSLSLPEPSEPTPMPPREVKKLDTPAPLAPVAARADALEVDFGDAPEVDPTGLLIPIADAVEPPAEPPAAPPAVSASPLDRLARYKVARCRECSAELLVGTFFCVECGKRID